MMRSRASAARATCCARSHDRPLTIDDVAREAAMSPFHFIRQFEALFGDDAAPVPDPGAARSGEASAGARATIP